jgi:hypothetical protein
LVRLTVERSPTIWDDSCALGDTVVKILMPMVASAEVSFHGRSSVIGLPTENRPASKSVTIRKKRLGRAGIEHAPPTTFAIVLLSGGVKKVRI